MAKAAKKVKWSIGADEPDDLQEFLSNDEIVLKNTNRKTKEVKWLDKGPHTFVVRKLSMKPNRNGDDRVSAMLVLKNPKGSDQSFNGYAIFDGFNVTEQGTPYLKRFLRGVGLEWKDFYNNTKAVDDGNDKQQITQIGKVKFDGSGKEVLVRAVVVVKDPDDYNDEEHLEIRRYIPADDEPVEVEDEEDDEDEEAGVELDEEDADAEDEDDDEEEEEEDAADDDDDDEEEEEDEDEEDDEDAEEELREELADLKIPALKKRALRSAKKAGVDSDDMPSKKTALIDWIVGVELSEPPF